MWCIGSWRGQYMSKLSAIPRGSLLVGRGADFDRPANAPTHKPSRGGFFVSTNWDIPMNTQMERRAEAEARKLARLAGMPESMWELFLLDAYKKLMKQG